MTDATLALPSVTRADRSKTSLWRRLLRQRNARVGLIVLGTIVLASLIGPLVMRGNPSSDFDYQNLNDAFLSPSASHLLGTDAFGRDVFLRILIGARYTLMLGFMAVLVGLAIGVPLGALSGYLGGWFDLIVQRFVDIILAFPGFLFALALVAVLGPGIENVVLAVAITSAPRFARLLRASVLSVKQMPYVEASRALGVKGHRALWRDVVPNSLGPVIVQTSLEMATAILTASGLGFLGLGVKASIPEWGSMLGAAREYVFTYPNLVTFPGLAIVIVVLALNLIGDGLRDALDPRLKR